MSTAFPRTARAARWVCENGCYHSGHYVRMWAGKLELEDSSCDRGVYSIGIVMFLFDPIRVCSVPVMCWELGS